MCPLLPWAFLRMAGGGDIGKDGGGFPKKGLPYLVSRISLYQNYGIKLRDVHERAVRDFGFTRVDKRMRVVWLGWMAYGGIDTLGLTS